MISLRILNSHLDDHDFAGYVEGVVRVFFVSVRIGQECAHFLRVEMTVAIAASA